MKNKILTVVVASANPVKVEAAIDGFRLMFPHVEFSHTSVAVTSGVPDQPLTDTETLTGALNRVENACAVHPYADFWIGIEGGVETMNGELAAFAWIVVRSASMTGKARSGTFFLPRALADLVEQGMELGLADDLVFNRNNSKQEGGAIGILTQNVVNRKQLYEQAVILALVPFRNEQLYVCATAAAR